jgi:hypothetical protein
LSMIQQVRPLSPVAYPSPACAPQVLGNGFTLACAHNVKQG